LKPEGWQLESPAVFRLLEKLRRAGKPLGEYVNGRFYRGILTGLNEAFIVDRATRDGLIREHKSSAEILKPFLRGRDVKRWRTEFAEQYLIKIESSENKDHPWSGKSEREAEKVFEKIYPAIHGHFQSLQDVKLEKPDARGCQNKLEQLQNRDDQGKYFWELRSCAYWNEFDKPGVIYPELALVPQYAYSHQGWICDCTLYVIPTPAVYLTALMNSAVVRFFFQQIAPKMRGDYMRFKALYMSQIPVPAVPPQKQKPVERLVELILSAKQRDAGADVSALEREIDELVYALYGLTPEEIQIVEGVK